MHLKSLAVTFTFFIMPKRRLFKSVSTETSTICLQWTLFKHCKIHHTTQ